LISSGANLNTAYKKGDTALTSAAMRGKDANVDIVGQLIDAGVDIDAQNRKGKTALHYACGADESICASLFNVLVVRKLVEGGVSMTRPDTGYYRTALMREESRGLSDIAAYLKGKEKEQGTGSQGKLTGLPDR
jgi:hypothetical protein